MKTWIVLAVALAPQYCGALSVDRSGRALTVPRGGADATTLKPTRSFLGRWLATLRQFLASFFDPAFGGSRAPTKQQQPPPAASARAAPKARRSKTVTIDDLKKMEGGAVKAVKTEAEFTKFIASPKLVVVDFFATWCGPCQNIKPKYAAMSDRFHKATFLAVDVDANKPIAQKYAVSSMPTFVFFKVRRLSLCITRVPTFEVWVRRARKSTASRGRTRAGWSSSSPSSRE